MTDAPERIWATEDTANFGEDRFHATTPMRGLTEYLRADIAAAREAELRAIIGAYQDGTLPDLTAVHMGATLDARREIERLRGLLDEAREGLGYYVDTLCEGFCEDMPDRAYTDQNCELDCSACKARATLARIGGQHD